MSLQHASSRMAGFVCKLLFYVLATYNVTSELGMAGCVGSNPAPGALPPIFSTHDRYLPIFTRYMCDV